MVEKIHYMFISGFIVIYNFDKNSLNIQMAQQLPNPIFVPKTVKQFSQTPPSFQRAPRRSMTNQILSNNEDHQCKFQRKQKCSMKTSCIQTSFDFSKQINSNRKNYSVFHDPSQIFKKSAGSGQPAKKEFRMFEKGPGFVPRSEKAKLCVSQIFTSLSGNSTTNIIQRQNQKWTQTFIRDQNDLKQASFKKVAKKQAVSTKTTVPSFILKRKQAKENSALISNVDQHSSPLTVGKVSQSYNKPLYKTQKYVQSSERHVSKECSIEQSVQNDEPNPFNQFQRLKLSYPKATASTISSQLQSYQSLKNFHDLEDHQELQIVQKTMEYDRKLPRITNRTKTVKGQTKFEELQDQFNDIFGDNQQQQESQELQNQVASQLLSLF